MEYMLKFRSTSLYTIIIVRIIKKGFLKKRERVKGFFIFMTVLLFKKVVYNYGKKEPCKQDCIWIIKFSHYLNLDMVNMVLLFFQCELEMTVDSACSKKKICKVNNF